MKHTYKIEIIAGAMMGLLLILYATLSMGIQNNKDAFQVNVFKVGDGFGYDITADNNILIKQENIPAIQQQKKFISYRQAEKAANVVVKKLNNRENPSISIEELKKLGILSALENK